jgi:maleate cis-trans isomerase
MTNYELTIAYLGAVEKKHKEYFESNGLRIMDCVQVEENNSVSVQLVKKDLPFDISNEIEMLFG